MANRHRQPVGCRLGRPAPAWRGRFAQHPKRARCAQCAAAPRRSRARPTRRRPPGASWPAQSARSIIPWTVKRASFLLPASMQGLLRGLARKQSEQRVYSMSVKMPSTPTGDGEKHPFLCVGVPAQAQPSMTAVCRSGPTKLT